MSKWEPIETAPKDAYEEVLLWDVGSLDAGCVVGFYDPAFDVWVGQFGECSLSPSHWMPLPKPPKHKRKKEQH